MTLDLSLYNFLYLCATLLSLILGVVMISFGVKENKWNILMGLAYLFLAHGIFLVLLIDSGLMPNFPSIYRTGNLAGLVYVPLTYLYFRGILFNKKLKAWDLVFFLPALIFFADFLPIYLLDSEEKLALILAEIKDPNLFVEYNQSRFFPSNFYTGFRSVFSTILWSMSVYLVLRFKRNSSLVDSQSQMIKWVLGYLFFQILLFAPFYFTYFIENQRIIFRVTHFAAALLCLFSSVYLLFFPRILYGLSLNEDRSRKSDQLQSSKQDQGKKIQKNKDQLEPEKVFEIEQQLERLMHEKKVYLTKGYTSHDLAKDAEIPYYVLTSYLNHIVGSSFPDYINRLRIQHCVALIESGEVDHLTLEGIGETCGFNNRNSFGVAFKKTMGQSPSEFVKSRKVY